MIDWPDLREDAIRVRWERITPRSEALFQLGRVLYAYIVPPKKEIVYIGKADGCTVGQRWCQSAKPEFWEYLDERGKGLTLTLYLSATWSWRRDGGSLGNSWRTSRAC
jgi:hypothetical protein